MSQKEITITLEADVKVIHKNDIRDNHIIINHDKYGIVNELAEDELLVVEVNTK